MAKLIRNISNIESLNTDIKYNDGKAVFIKAGQAIDVSKFNQDIFNKSLKEGMIGKMIAKKWLIFGDAIIGSAEPVQKLENQDKIDATKKQEDLKAKIVADQINLDKEKAEIDEDNPILQNKE
jgi:hypothetical protein